MNIFVEMSLAGVKLKVGPGSATDDASRVRLGMRGPDFVIACGANQAWTLAQAIKLGRLRGNLNLGWLEEPVHCYDEIGISRQVRQAIHIPICAGEGEISSFGCSDLAKRMT